MRLSIARCTSAAKHENKPLPKPIEWTKLGMRHVEKRIGSWSEMGGDA